MIAPVSKKRRDGRSSFHQLAQYILEELDPLTGERQFRGEFMLSDDLMGCSETPDEAIQTAAIFMHATAVQNKRVSDPVFHFQLTWPKGEQPTKEQWEDAVKNALANLRYPIGDRAADTWGSYADHQFIAGVHRETDYFHVHIMVNKVHPVTLRSRTPDYYELALAKSCRESEHAHGWTESSGAFEWDSDLNIAVEVPREERARRREQKEMDRCVAQEGAGELEYYGSTESLIGSVRRKVAPEVRQLLKRESASWKDLQEVLAKHGLEMHKGENGGYTIEQVNTGISVRASKVFRENFAGKENRDNTEKRLGEWTSIPPELHSEARLNGPIRSDEPWGKRTGGFAALDDEEKDAATESHRRWKAELGQQAEKVTLEEYVRQCQRPAERRIGRREQLKESQPTLRTDTANGDAAWKKNKGGYMALSAEDKVQAEKSYQRWVDGNPHERKNTSIERYVAHRQELVATRDTQREARRKSREADRKALKAEYVTYQQQCRVQRREVAAEYRERKLALREQLKRRKKAIRAYDLAWVEKRAMLAETMRENITTLQVMKYEYTKRLAELKSEPFERWTTARAQAGDSRAIAQLRGWRYQDRRNLRRIEQAAKKGVISTLSLSGPQTADPVEIDWYRIVELQRSELELLHQRELAESFARIRHTVDIRTGDVSFSIKGKIAVIDRGKQLSVLDHGEAAQVFALEMAVQKYGRTLSATGTEQWREMIARTAARNGIQVKFTDPAMNRVIEEEDSKTKRSRDLFEASRVARRHAEAFEGTKRSFEIGSKKELLQFIAGTFSNGRTLSACQDEAEQLFKQRIMTAVASLPAGRSLDKPIASGGSEITARKSADGKVTWSCWINRDPALRMLLAQRFRAFEATLYNLGVNERRREHGRSSESRTGRPEGGEVVRTKTKSRGISR